jgi:hypothetical protein
MSTPMSDDKVAFGLLGSKSVLGEPADQGPDVGCLCTDRYPYVMNKVNDQPSPLCPPKARYTGVDAGRRAKHYGVAFSLNDGLLQAIGTRQFDGALIARAALATQEVGVFWRNSVK